MRVAKFWHKTQQSARDAANKAYWLTSWGSSNHSSEEAAAAAASTMERWREKLRQGVPINEYEYADAAIREELIEEFVDDAGTLVGAITRNRYGALVLNTINLLIADIDVAEGGVSWFGRLLGRKPRDKAFVAAHIEDYLRQRGDLAGRLYATRAGLRLLITNREFQPSAAATQALLTDLGTDWLYQTLCQRQDCFRARLTPKPWRCGMPAPPNRFPRETAPARDRFASWLHAYQQHSAGTAACHLLTTAGSGWPLPAHALLVQVHDRHAVNPNAALA